MKMRRSFALSIVLAMMFAVAAGPASAGGWATIELSKPVNSAVVGEAITFEFQILQHGMPDKAVEGDRPTVVATPAESGDKLEATATETTAGHYAATLTFDQPGRWKLRAASQSFPSSSAFPTLTVSSDATAATLEPNSEQKATAEMKIIASTFTPSRLEVSTGTTVAFVNEDQTKHEVAFYEASVDDSGIMSQNQTFTVTFTEPGEYHLACGPHPGMSATIIVK